VHDQRGWNALIAIGYTIQQPRPQHPETATEKDRDELKKLEKAAAAEQREHPDATIEIWAADEHRIGLKHADRGMISAANIANIDYILGVRERSTKEVRSEVIEDDGVTIPLVIKRQRGETQLEIKDVTLLGRRYVLCRNEEEAKKDAGRRALLLAGLERKPKEGDKALVGNKGFRRFVKSGPDKFSIDYDKAEDDAKFDGIFVLRTNTKLYYPLGRSFFAIEICWR
jgi:hypothetical protein